MENSIKFKIKTRYYLELWTPKTMKLLGGAKVWYFIFLETFDSEFSYIQLWFTDQNSKPLEIEDKINITLVIN